MYSTHKSCLEKAVIEIRHIQVTICYDRSSRVRSRVSVSKPQNQCQPQEQRKKGGKLAVGRRFYDQWNNCHFTYRNPKRGKEKKKKNVYAQSVMIAEKLNFKMFLNEIRMCR